MIFFCVSQWSQLHVSGQWGAQCSWTSLSGGGGSSACGLCCVRVEPMVSMWHLSEEKGKYDDTGQAMVDMGEHYNHSSLYGLLLLES